jgi:hypothetical protein
MSVCSSALKKHRIHSATLMIRIAANCPIARMLFFGWEQVIRIDKLEYMMIDKIRPALKHGGYSNTTLLPGEDKAAFEKLHNDLIAEFDPSGRLEEDIVHTMARIVWRKQNLITYRLVEQVNSRYWQISEKFFPTRENPLLAALSAADERDPEQIEQARRDLEKQARKELGDDWKFVSNHTIENMFDDWTVIERIDAMIDRCIKRLLMVRGVKSMSISAPTASSIRKSRPAA